MGADKLTCVRVLPSRSLSLPQEHVAGGHYVAGDVLELPAAEAKQLIRDGFVERAK